MNQKTEILLPYIRARLRVTPDLLREYTQKDGEPYRYREVFFRIKEYIDHFIAGDDENRFLIVPGLRGVGKTTILLQLYDYLLNQKKIDQNRILYLSSDELNLFLDTGIYEAVHTFVEEVHRTSLVNLEEQLFIFIDEAHYDPKWSETGKIVYDQTRKIFMIFTGSSALSMEMTVDAARRATRRKVFPLGFSEYILLKYDIKPPEKMAKTLRELIWTGDDKSLENARQKENEMQKNLVVLDRSPRHEWEDFLYCGGFPFGLKLDQTEIYEKIFDILDRIVQKDVYSLKSFNTDTLSTISQVITFLALQKPGGTSDAKLAHKLDVSPTIIRTILTVLEKTHLIFSVKPYGGAGKTVRKPWKYYFLSPSLNTAVNFKLGRYRPDSREILGVLSENLVGAYFFRLKETMNLPHGIFYDPAKGGVDFLLVDPLENIIPVEVGIGRKDKGQILRAIRKYRSEYGMVISNTTAKIEKEGDIIFIPLMTFSYL